MIPKLRASETPHETLADTRKELEFVRRKLGQERTKHLVDRVGAVFEQLATLELRLTTADDLAPAVEAFLESVNKLRCELFGELTSIACCGELNESFARNFFRQPQSVAPPSPVPVERPRGPMSVQGWIDVANERASDARALQGGERSCGAVYMAGYAVECSLKALLRAMGKPFPTSGREGHNLRALWEAAGYKLTDLHDEGNGARTFFVEEWSTDLRYEISLGGPRTADELLNGAFRLTGLIQTRVQRENRKRAGKGR